MRCVPAIVRSPSELSQKYMISFTESTRKCLNFFGSVDSGVPETPAKLESTQSDRSGKKPLGIQPYIFTLNKIVEGLIWYVMEKHAYMHELVIRSALGYI